jgi:hypothetical protein
MLATAKYGINPEDWWLILEMASVNELEKFWQV